jgi:Concanavalin A-like lectin/glucanases superfamily
MGIRRGNQNFIGGIKDGLVLYLDATTSLLSSSYGVAGDNTNWNTAFGNYNPTLINSPIYTGSFGGCINFNGTNQYVSIPRGGGLNNSSAYTIEVWVKWNGIQSKSPLTIWGPICGRQYNGTNSQNIIGLNGANPTGSKIVYFSTNYYYLTGSSNVGLNTWNYVSIVFSSGKSNIYKNGIFENSGSGGGTFDNTGIVLSLGAWIDDGNTYASCSIGSLSIYNRALSLNEITTSYSGSKGRFGL